MAEKYIGVPKFWHEMIEECPGNYVDQEGLVYQTNAYRIYKERSSLPDQQVCDFAFISSQRDNFGIWQKGISVLIEADIREMCIGPQEILKIIENTFFGIIGKHKSKNRVVGEFDDGCKTSLNTMHTIEIFGYNEELNLTALRISNFGLREAEEVVRTGRSGPKIEIRN